MKRIDAYWQTRNAVALLLLPLSGVFRLLSSIRRYLYRKGIFKVHKMSAPVIVVGNISVGGSGKSPLVIWLARHLQSIGRKPGIVSRGYGGQARTWPQEVRAGSDPRTVGDEPVMVARLSGCPMSVGPDRVAAAKALLQYKDCDIVISDDGMQHYALGRDIEIAVIDGKRRHGNGYLLPAGPLRESPARLEQVDMIVSKGHAEHGEHLMQYQLGDAVKIRDGISRRSLSEFSILTVHAVAGIGNPADFFSMLKAAGLTVIEHPFPDHHKYRPEDIQFNDGKPVLMTQKDAVKCEEFSGPMHWYIPLEAVLKESFIHRFNRIVSKL